MKRTPPILGTIIFAISIILVAAIAVLVIKNRTAIFGGSSEGQEPQTTNTAPTPTVATVTSTPTPTPSNQTATPEPTKPPTTTNDIGEQNVEGSITITRAVVENQTLVVRTVLSTTEPGTCSMVVGLSDGSFYTTETVDTTTFSGNSACSGFDVPFSEFAPAEGVSDIEVRYQNSQGLALTTGSKQL